MSESCMITFVYEGSQRNANAKEVRGDFENMYRVALDDGYENNFFISPERPYVWYEQHVGYTELAAAVGSAIEKVFF
jgi:hypothetical protein